MQHGDPVRQLHDHLHVVLDDQDRQVRRDAADQGHGVMGLGRAHACRRLVQAEQLRLGRQRDADLQMALLAVGQVGRQLVLLAAQADRLQHRFGALDEVAIRAVVRQQAPAVPPRLGGDADVLKRGGIGQDVGDLIRAGDALPGDPLGRQARDVLAVEQDLPRGRAQVAGQAIEEGALARPVRPDDRADLLALDFEADAVQGHQATKAHGQALGTEDRGPLAGTDRVGHFEERRPRPVRRTDRPAGTSSFPSERPR